jgi:alpha-L-fucosidase
VCLGVWTLIAGLALGGLPASAGIFRDDESVEQREARMAWWRDAKFGMFVHWGLYAAAEGQWKGAPGGIDPEEYVRTLAPRMNLENFDPEAWADMAADAGMKYFVVTAKHHDGFGMVDFPSTDYDIADRTPYGADPMIPLAEAMRARGLKFGFYFSQSQDWSRPGGRPDWFKGLEGDWDEYVEHHAVPQLRHLLSGRYGTLDLLWFDSGGVTKTQTGAEKIWQELTAQPDILVNNRLKFGRRGDFEPHRPTGPGKPV